MKQCSKIWHKCKHPGDTISSKYTFHCGWRAALEWVLKNRKPYYDIEDKKVVATDSDIIYKELEEV